MFRDRMHMKLVAATVGGAIGLVAAVPMPAAAGDDRTVDPMPGVFKRCDFSADTFVDARGDARALAFIGRGGQQTVSAEVQLATAEPNTRYDVRLIQMPRPSLACAATDPGVTAGSLFTDGVGAGTLTLNGPRLSDTTGAWVFVERPGEFSQLPVEFYSSSFIAKV